jgi:hypothetical protein
MNPTPADPDVSHLFERAPDALSNALLRLARSPRYRQAAAIAALGECPTASEVRALERAILPPHRAAALGAHLAACPRCLDSSLAALAPIARMRRVLPQLAAAAAILVAVALSFSAGDAMPRAARALPQVALTDASGFEMRSGASQPASTHRFAAVVARAGHLALLRVGTDAIEVLAIDGAAQSVAVTADEEVLLPLDRAVATRTGETFLVIHTDAILPRAALLDLAPRLLRGEEFAGVEASRVVLR